MIDLSQTFEPGFAQERAEKHPRASHGDSPHGPWIGLEHAQRMDARRNKAYRRPRLGNISAHCFTSGLPSRTKRQSAQRKEGRFVTRFVCLHNNCRIAYTSGKPCSGGQGEEEEEQGGLFACFRSKDACMSVVAWTPCHNENVGHFTCTRSPSCASHIPHAYSVSFLLVTIPSTPKHHTQDTQGDHFAKKGISVYPDR